MFSNSLTKEIIKKVMISTFGVSSEIANSDINIFPKNLIDIKVKVDPTINVAETVLMMQKQIYYELSEKTDFNDYKIDIVIGE
ncbi:MAG: hypothetical protein K2I67_01095 [Malacoplasma sp.]|nr:hypothetical protein [Malacoplasma sp.]